MTRPLLLAIDPSLRCTGWLLVALDGTAELVAAGAVQTEPHAAQKDPFILRMRDDAYAAYALQRGIEEVVAAYPSIEQVAIENLTGPHTRRRRGTKRCPACGDDGARMDTFAFAKGARAQQAILAALHPGDTGLRPLFVSTYAAKESATGRRRPKRGKNDVADRVRARWGAPAWDRVIRGDAGAREAIYDAGAVALFALEDVEVLRVIENYRREYAPRRHVHEREDR